MSCLINIIGIPLAIGLVGYAIFYFIRANSEAQASRKARAQAMFEQRQREKAILSDPWKANPQDSKFFNDDGLL